MVGVSAHAPRAEHPHSHRFRNQEEESTTSRADQFPPSPNKVRPPPFPSHTIRDWGNVTGPTSHMDRMPPLGGGGVGGGVRGDPQRVF